MSKRFTHGEGIDKKMTFLQYIKLSQYLIIWEI